MRKTNSFELSKSYAKNVDIKIKSISKELTNSDVTCKSHTKEPAWKCRYIVTIFGFLVQFSIAANRSIMSVSIVAMVNNSAISEETAVKSDSCPDLLKNTTEDEIFLKRKLEGEFIWSPEIQGYILGSYFFGYMITLIPTGRLAEKYGCKWFLFGSSLASGLLMLLTPPFASLSAFAVIIIQTLRGLSQGLLGPCVAVLLSNWCPKEERGFIYSIIMSAPSLGPVFVNIFAGYVSESPAGWPFVFYTTGVLGVVFAASIMFFLVESPNDHPSISKPELNFILSHQERTLSRKRPKLPWQDLLTSVPVYALIFVMFGRFWSISQFWIVHSTFLGTILHYSIGQNGLLSALPFLLSFLLSQIAAWMTLYVERKRIVSIDFLRKFFVFVSSFGYSICLFGIYIAGCDRKLSIIFAFLSVGFTGLGSSGCLIIPTDMSPTFSGTVHSISNALGFSSSVILSVLVGYLTEGNQTLKQWNKVFFISIGIVMTSAITFVIFGSAKIQPWNFVEEEHGQKDDRESEINKIDEGTKF